MTGVADGADRRCRVFEVVGGGAVGAGQRIERDGCSAVGGDAIRNDIGHRIDIESNGVSTGIGINPAIQDATIVNELEREARNGGAIEVRWRYPR
ncbi:MAG: hypothetical protein AW10_00317 [Candidatus Accumulibacter appositus]|uniref:Uncharacterized protein n=1 Tax=Candidatus Accumulibacter appositus TaxID=1454003 RepID=A0A011Q0Y8_9PROT|nr:MAG: hypothetical protein AW10_00317 [Candidatus Accumulibacter appositus]